MQKRLKELDLLIQKQKEENVRLYSIFCYNLHDAEMQPLVKEWRKGSATLKALIEEKNEILDSCHPKTSGASRVFVNSYGEATKRVITSASYERQQKRIAKEVMRFIS